MLLISVGDALSRSGLAWKLAALLLAFSFRGKDPQTPQSMKQRQVKVDAEVRTIGTKAHGCHSTPDSGHISLTVPLGDPRSFWKDFLKYPSYSHSYYRLPQNFAHTDWTVWSYKSHRMEGGPSGVFLPALSTVWSTENHRKRAWRHSLLVVGAVTRFLSEWHV